MSYQKVAQLKTAEKFRSYLETLNVNLPFDETVQHGNDSPLAQPLHVGDVTIGNRFTILPMEGWDASPDGRPTDLVKRRWQRFGRSGAKLIWGGEAVAVQHDGRANPHQLLLTEDTVDDIASLHMDLVNAHAERFGSDDLLVGLQLTHSGRFSRPNDKRLEPRTLYRHPLLDAKVGINNNDTLLTDDQIDALIERFATAAHLAQQAGFAFVDIKHCHGYLGHEFLSAHDREGRYGGSFENRTRFLRNAVAAVRSAAPGLLIGVRLSAFDFVPFRPGADGVGVPSADGASYRFAFGAAPDGLTIDLTETLAFLSLLEQLDIRLVCLTAGSPYYNPHIQRPALFPPSDGYQPPEDPLVGVARQINTMAVLKRAFPSLIMVGSGYSYLQEWLPHVAQYTVRTGMIDSVGIGRMALSYPDLPADVLNGNPVKRKLFCRTFSDCTTAPRKGLISGCYPLDDFYAQREEAAQLTALKKQ
jgi:NADPH2 dehydrogenase